MSLINDILVLFPDAKSQNGYVRCRCPFHAGGNERHPSMSIVTKEGHNGMSAGYYKCFSCGATGMFSDLAESFGMQYVPDTYVLEPEANQPILKLTTQQAIYKKDTPYCFSPYLAKRGISEDVQKKFKVYEKVEEHKVYMPVFSRTEQYLFANARATNTKKFYIDLNSKASLAGIELIDFAKPIAIVESQINLMTLETAQYAHGVALLGATKIASLKDIKDAVGPFLLMFDGDEAGSKAAIEAEKYLGSHRCIIYDFKNGEDVNSLWQACEFNQDNFFEELEERILPF